VVRQVYKCHEVQFCFLSQAFSILSSIFRYAFFLQESLIQPIYPEPCSIAVVPDLRILGILVQDLQRFHQVTSLIGVLVRALGA
jgi:hypothetical protein